jgi:hypothetical protein
VPRGLTLSQRLTGPDGLPTWAARGGVVALMALAGALGYSAAPGAEPSTRPARTVEASRLAGELPIATPEPRAELRAAAAMPRMRGGATRRDRRRPVAPDAAAVAAPVPTATPAPAATPVPAPDVPVGSPPAPAPAPTAAPRPRATPAPTFDSSG